MTKVKVVRGVSKAEWLQSALKVMGEEGVDKITVEGLARSLGITKAGFYWHFKNRRELHDALLEYWERETTDVAIEVAKQFDGPPEERIWSLMQQVMTVGLARLDLAMWHWAQSDAAARKVFNRALAKRFAFAAWMFREIGFSNPQADARGRMMVVYMMGESTLVPEEPPKRRRLLRLKYEILINPLGDD